MARVALIGPDGNVVRVSENGDPNADTKAGWRWLLCPAVERPASNPLTETVEGPDYQVGASSVTEVWTKRSLTAEEIAAQKDDVIVSVAGARGLLVDVLLSMHNRIRVLEGQPAHTLAQFKAALKARL